MGVSGLSYHTRYHREKYKLLWVRREDAERLRRLCESKGLTLLDCITWLVDLASRDHMYNTYDPGMYNTYRASPKIKVLCSPHAWTWEIVNLDTGRRREVSRILVEDLCEMEALPEEFCKCVKR
jgi:hypothetical protein